MWTSAKMYNSMRQTQQQMNQQLKDEEELAYRKAFTNATTVGKGKKHQFLPSIKWEFSNAKPKFGQFPPERIINSITKPKRAKKIAVTHTARNTRQNTVRSKAPIAPPSKVIAKPKASPP